MSYETPIMNAKSKLRALDHRRSRLACKMASKVGIEGPFFVDQLPLDDPRISQYADELEKLNGEIYDAAWELDRLENIDEPKRHIARQQCFDFINLLSIEEASEFLRSLGLLTTLELVDALIENPNLIEEAVLNE